MSLAWSTVAPPDGLGTVTYHVTRNGGGAPGGDCPTSAAPTQVTSCTDSGLSAGTYNYTVTAHWRSWTATSLQRDVTLSSGAATHFVLGAASTTPTAGDPDALTITAKDAQGNTVSAYTGDKSLTFSGAGTVGSYRPTVTDKTGSAVDFGTAQTITFTNGVATVNGSSNGVMRLYKAETALIVASDGAINNSASPLEVTVSAAAKAKLAFTQQPSNSTGGIGFPSQPQVTIQDTFGNTITGATDGVTLAIGANPGGGALTCTTNPLAASAGVAAFSGCKIDKAGTRYTLTANASGLTSATSAPFDITGIAFRGIGSETSFTASKVGETVFYPTGTEPGDVLLAVMVNNADQTSKGPTATPKAACPQAGTWTKLADVASAGTTPQPFRMTVWWKVASASDTGGCVTTNFQTDSKGATAWVVGYRGVSATGTAFVPSGATAVADPQSRTLTPTPNLITNAPNATVISLVGIRAPNALSLSTPRGFTPRASTIGANPPGGRALGVADAFVPSATTVASPTWAQTGTPAQWAWATVAFKP